MKSTAALLMFITVLSKIIGLFRDKMMAYYFGTGPIARAIVTSSTIPLVLFGMIASGLATGYIPVYSRMNHEKGKLAADEFTSNLINILFLLTTAFVVVGLVFAKEIVFIFAPGYTVEKEMTVLFTRFAILGLYGTAWGSVFQGYLQIHGHYSLPALIGFVLNSFVIAGMIIAVKVNQYWIIGLSLFLGGTLQYLIFLPQRRELGYVHQRVLNLKAPELKSLLFIGLPVLLGVAVSDINMLVDKSIASLVSAGGVASLNYANRIFGFVTGIVVTSISASVYPSLVNGFEEDQLDVVKKLFRESVTGIGLLVIPATAGLWIFSKEIVTLLFAGGSFGSGEIEETRMALLFYSFGLLGFGFRDIISKSFYAMHQSKTPMKNSLFVVILNILLNLFLSKLMGIRGLALASSISITLGAICLLISLTKKIGILGLNRVGKNIAKIVGATFIMSGASRFFFLLMKKFLTSSNISFLLSVFVAVLIYGICILHFRIDGIDELMDGLKHKFGKLQKR